ncbi:MAG: 3-hydroxyacyl-CoA dehydrogenase family protein [Pirellulales bacterium]|nr:3-hydroxyacyl-CoA dehydrogenase family protein [Pirellulales bacterium]
MVSGGSDREGLGILLVGAGVVGRAILKAHVDAEVSLSFADQDHVALREAVAELNLESSRWRVSEISPLHDSLAFIRIQRRGEDQSVPPLVIESITEKLSVKQAFFQHAETWLDDKVVFCSNTSTLRIGEIGHVLGDPSRLCGLHFFMPVQQRWAVEVVQAEQTSSSAIEICRRHLRRLGKTPLEVSDRPGFIVNRLLSPYLNEAMLLLGRGVHAGQLERAALAYGMPLSPLELADLIGIGTLFDAGRAFWQAFPTRLDPSPIPAALIKAGRLGRAAGAGFYNYDQGRRGDELPAQVVRLCKKYQRHVVKLADQEVMLMLAIPMWIEAALAFSDGAIRSPQQLDTAMGGGLGYQRDTGWLSFFDRVGSERLLQMMDQFGPTAKSLRAPEELAEGLRQGSPSQALLGFAAGRSD